MPPPKQKPTAPTLPVRFGRAFSQLRGGDEVLGHLRASTCPNMLRRPFLRRRDSRRAGQPVGREGQEAGDAEAARDVLDVRIEAAVLVDHEDAGQLAAGVGRAHEVALDLAVALRRGTRLRTRS